MAATYPRRIADDLASILERIEAVALRALRGPLGRAMEETDPNRRADALAASVRSQLTQLRRALARAWTESRIRREIERAAARVDRRQAQNFEVGLIAALGTQAGQRVAVGASPPARITRAWVAETTARIVTIRDAAVPRLAVEIEEAFRRGTRAETLRRRWIKAGIPTKSGTISGRAKVIARDQIASINALLTRERQQAVGIESYRWRTNIDGREREEHRERDGEIFRWDSPPEDGHPGEPIQCRCWAEPILDPEALAGAAG